MGIPRSRHTPSYCACIQLRWNGCAPLFLKRIIVHSIDGEETDPALFNVRREGADHALAFLLPFVTSAGGKGENGHAVMAVNDHAHVAIETVR